MKNNSPLLITVNGWSGSGKTTFCERLILELTGRGYRVSAAKNSHREIQPDKEGSDSKRFFDAGADTVCLNSESSMTLFHHSRIDSGNQLTELFPAAEFIIAEGFKSAKAFRIELTGTADKISEMKNNPKEAEMIVYGSQNFAESLENEGFGTRKFDEDRTSVKSCKPILIDRDDISKAADIICRIKFMD